MMGVESGYGSGSSVGGTSDAASSATESLCSTPPASPTPSQDFDQNPGRKRKCDHLEFSSSNSNDNSKRPKSLSVPSEDSSNDDGDNDGKPGQEHKRQERKRRNRESAERSRQRKLQYYKQLEVDNAALKVENKVLWEKLEASGLASDVVAALKSSGHVSSPPAAAAAAAASPPPLCSDPPPPRAHPSNNSSSALLGLSAVTTLPAVKLEPGLQQQQKQQPSEQKHQARIAQLERLVKDLESQLQSQITKPKSGSAIKKDDNNNLVNSKTCKKHDSLRRQRPAKTGQALSSAILDQHNRSAGDGSDEDLLPHSCLADPAKKIVAPLDGIDELGEIFPMDVDGSNFLFDVDSDLFHVPPCDELDITGTAGII